MNTYTIGFTKKNARNFFNFLRDNGVHRLIDVRLNNVSQLSGYAKKDDLKFFLKEICNAEYLHIPDWAPTDNILKSYKNGNISWEKYEDLFLNLMAKRNIEQFAKPELLKNSCLLCSEHEPHHCHRRLVVEYLNQHTDLSLSVKHLY
ncbi:hypothetical protein CO614_08935 [Lysobacteraceae bacterium NML120232]|nr:hypothetical protein CO608_09290 [Xanthomonadaceae bacterium NML08-0793]PJK09788.1 hypothetical protein CO614_08935 [Xanthomonadaceae bacterium NML120232]